MEILAATLMSLGRTVAVTAFPRAGLARVPAARVRLNAMQASTSQAALAVNTLDGKCAIADAFISASKFSMIAWWRWVLSASTVVEAANTGVAEGERPQKRSQRRRCVSSLDQFPESTVSEHGHIVHGIRPGECEKVASTRCLPERKIICLTNNYFRWSEWHSRFNAPSKISGRPVDSG